MIDGIRTDFTPSMRLLLFRSLFIAIYWVEFTSATLCVVGANPNTSVTDWTPPPPPPCTDLFIGGLSCGGLNAPVTNGLLHTLGCAWRARHLRGRAERKSIQNVARRVSALVLMDTGQIAGSILGKHLHMTAINSADRPGLSARGNLCGRESVSKPPPTTDILKA